jgi:hypothetical protein
MLVSVVCRVFDCWARRFTRRRLWFSRRCSLAKALCASANLKKLLEQGK